MLKAAGPGRKILGWILYLESTFQRQQIGDLGEFRGVGAGGRFVIRWTLGNVGVEVDRTAVPADVLVSVCKMWASTCIHVRKQFGFIDLADSKEEH